MTTTAWRPACRVRLPAMCREIVAFSDLIGAGRSEVPRTIFGAHRVTVGEIHFEGRPICSHSPTDTSKNGVAMRQENRKVLSLFMGMQIIHNISMAQLPYMTRAGSISERRERSVVNDFVRKLDIRLPSLFPPVSSLSGGAGAAVRKTKELVGA